MVKIVRGILFAALLAGAVWVGAVHLRPSSEAAAVVNSRFGRRHPGLIRVLLIRPGEATYTINGVELQETTHIYTGPWAGVPINFPAHGKTVVLYGLTWKTRRASGHVQLYVVLGPKDRVLQTLVTGFRGCPRLRRF